MLYLKAQELSQIQDVFHSNPLQDETEIDKFYQDATEARTGDAYSGFVEKMDLLLEDSHHSHIHKLFIGHAGVGKTTELFRLKHIAEEKGFLTCLGRCDIDLDSGDIEYTDVLFYILDLLVNKACDEGLKISDNVVKKIENYWNSNTELHKTISMQLSYTPEYKDIQVWFPNPEKLPMIKIKNWQQGVYQENYTEGMETIKAIIGKRADLALFTNDALQELITYTGGYIRDLFRCICDAALRARLRKSKVIELEDARKALTVLESDINGRYSDELIGKMEDIYKGNKHVSSSEEITVLLQIGAVLEYNGTRWCDLHPLVEKWLIENNKITG